jgi:hypothetical protein
MQTHLAGRADVHGRTQAHRLQAFENLDVFAGVAAVVLQQEAALRSPGDEYLPGIASEFGACATFLVLFLWRRINDQLPRSTYFQASWKVYCTGAVLFFICIPVFHAETLVIAD